MATQRACVTQGALLLDRVCPQWATRVNPRTIQVLDPQNCVLGQVFGDYEAGLKRLEIPLTSNEVWGHGFHLPPRPGLFEGLMLNRAWQSAVTIRQEKIEIDFRKLPDGRVYATMYQGGIPIGSRALLIPTSPHVAYFN